MLEAQQEQSSVQLEVSLDVLCRLLRDKNLVAAEFKCLNPTSRRAGWWAVKRAAHTPGF